MRTRPGYLAVSLVGLTLALASSLTAQVRIESRREILRLATPAVLESVVMDPMTRQANLGAVVLRYNLFRVNVVWQHPGTVELNSGSLIAVSSTNWIPGPHTVRLEVNHLPIPAKLVRYWYVGTTRQEATCDLPVGSVAVCEHTLTVSSASESLFFELRSENANHNFQSPLGRLTVSRLASSP